MKVEPATLFIATFLNQNDASERKNQPER